MNGCIFNGIINLLNNTPIEWFLNNTNTIDMETYGSDFFEACILVDQIVGFFSMLRILEFPLNETLWLFGENLMVVNSDTSTSGKLHKHQKIFNCHRVIEDQEEIIHSVNIDGKKNNDYI